MSEEPTPEVMAMLKGVAYVAFTGMPLDMYFGCLPQVEIEAMRPFFNRIPELFPEGTDFAEFEPIEPPSLPFEEAHLEDIPDF